MFFGSDHGGNTAASAAEFRGFLSADQRQSVRLAQRCPLSHRRSPHQPTDRASSPQLGGFRPALIYYQAPEDDPAWPALVILRCLPPIAAAVISKTGHPVKRAYRWQGSASSQRRTLERLLRSQTVSY